MKDLIDNFIRDITKATPMSKSEARRRLEEIRKETAEYVCDKMVGTEYADEIKFEWNDRIIREKEIKQSILQDFIQEVNKMTCDECEDECNPIVYSLCLRRKLDERERSTDV